MNKKTLSLLIATVILGAGAGGGYYYYQQQIEKQLAKQQAEKLEIQYLQAKQLFDEGEHQKAIQQYQQLAEQNQADAQFSLYELYLEGKKVKKNEKIAIFWLKKAAENNHISAQLNLSVYYLAPLPLSDEINPDPKLGLMWLEKAAKTNNPNALTILGRMYKAGDVVEKNIKKAIELFEKAAEQKYAEAHWALVEVYRDKETGMANEDKASKHYTNALILGHKEAQYEFAKTLYDMRSYKDAISDLEAAAEQDHADAQYLLAEIYYDGKGVEKNLSAAAKWYEKAAENGNKDSYFRLGYMYSTGEGVKRNDYTAIKWWKKATDNGDKAAQFNLALIYLGQHKGKEAVPLLLPLAEDGDYKAQDLLGRIYKDGNGVTQDYAEAAKWYQKAVDQGYDVSQVSLGLLYEAGNGVKQDKAKAVELFQKAANKGNQNAQANLGFMYQTGQGVKQDEKQAVSWYEKSANQGNLLAMKNLAGLYLAGKGVAKNEKKAVEWLQKAADKGDRDAQFELGLRYANGNGVAQNHAKAIEWYRKAALRGHGGAWNNLAVLKANGYPVEYLHYNSKVYSFPKEMYEQACKLGNQMGCENYKNYKGFY